MKKGGKGSGMSALLLVNVPPVQNDVSSRASASIYRSLAELTDAPQYCSLFDEEAQASDDQVSVDSSSL